LLAIGGMLELKLLGTLDLRDGTGREAGRVLAQPKRLALLAYLALAGTGAFRRRDEVLAHFWPDVDDESGRLSLRQALHFLRQALGPEAIVGRGVEEIAIGAALRCDALDFQRAIAEGRVADALDLYRGDLLPGLHVTDAAPEFGQWLDTERARLRSLAARAAWSLAERAEHEGDAVDASHRARQAVSLAPDDEAGVRRLIALLDRLGDRRGALRAYEDFARVLRSEFDVAPSIETRVLVDAIRARETVRHQPAIRTRQASAPPAENTDGVDTSAPTGALRGPEGRVRGTTRFLRSRQRLLAAGIALAAAVTGGAALATRSSHGSVPVIAVGFVEAHGGEQSAATAEILPGLFETDLSGVHGLDVVGRARMLEILGQLGAQEGPSTLSDAARRAGATELLEGAVFARPDGSLQLDVRRVDLASGVVKQAYSVAGADAFDLAERATQDITESFHLPPRPRSVANDESRSLAARRLYEGGLRAYYSSQWRGAYDLFTAALREDSLFAMAAYLAGLSQEAFGAEGWHATMQRAARLAAFAPARDRLIVRVGTEVDYPIRLAMAESLVTAYPHEPAGHLAVATMRVDAGEFAAAVPELRRVITMDSAGLGGPAPWCDACNAYRLLVRAYLYADSFPAAESVVREWMSRTPGASSAPLALFEIESRRGRRDAALSALARATAIQPGAGDPNATAIAAIRADDFRAADAFLRDKLRVNPSDDDALWWYVISLRGQGRLVEALSVARRMVAATRGDDSHTASLAEAQVLVEQGRWREGAALFDSLAEVRPSAPGSTARGYMARHWGWLTTLAADARAAHGDTVGLSQLADSVDFVTRMSGFGRDWRLAHHLRGLLGKARGNRDQAIAELRSAVFSPTEGYTRTSVELADLLVASGRATEAITYLQPALRGPTESSNLYVTRTELHEALARAFDAAGQPDSAAAHYRLVGLAWQAASPALRARARAAAARVAALSPAARTVSHAVIRAPS
jgi:DNA-binding SARP family transcriptional activator/tetratricopeptide (TPR) repeat protein